MKYKSGPRFDYIADDDYGVLPSGEVVFLKDNIPEDIKQRVIEDIKREMAELSNPPEGAPLLSFI